MVLVKNPLISIILPTYNGECYIAESVCSIISQTYSNWELIIVNDSSTDNTPKIIDALKLSDSRIKVIHNLENKKLPEALNIGFRKANGDLLSWTSDDNIYLPNALSELAKLFILDGNLGFAFSSQEIIDEEGKTKESSIPKYKLADLAYKNICGGCFMYTKEAAKMVGFYDSSLFCAEDYDYFCRLALKSKILYYPKILYKYRKHSKNLSITKKNIADKNANIVRLKYAENLMNKYEVSIFEAQYIYYKLFKLTGRICFLLKCITYNPLNIIKILIWKLKLLIN